MKKDQQSILILQPWLNYRGAETQSIQMCEDFNMQGLHSKIVCLYVHPNIYSTVNRDLVIAPSLLIQKLLMNKIIFFLFGFWILLFLSLKVGAHYSIYNPHNFPSVWVAVITSWIYKKKIIWTVHNFPQHPFLGKVAFFFERLIFLPDFLIVARVDMIVAVSKKVQQQVKDIYKRKCSVIYLGIDLKFYAQSLDLSDHYAELNNKKILLQAGRVIESKNLQFSVSLFEVLAISHPELVLVFAGEGDPKFLHISSKNKNRVYFIGKQSRRDLVYWYQRSLFVISPAVASEGCTTVPLEAWAAGSYPIVAAGCGSDEILIKEHVGYVFENELGVTAVAEHISDIYSNSFRQDMTSLDNYSRESCISQYLLLINSLLLTSN
jgi:glycosyltransferase involved in cell wall biosynthesis